MLQPLFLDLDHGLVDELEAVVMAATLGKSVAKLVLSVGRHGRLLGGHTSSDLVDLLAVVTSMVRYLVDLGSVVRCRVGPVDSAVLLSSIHFDLVRRILAHVHGVVSFMGLVAQELRCDLTRPSSVHSVAVDGLLSLMKVLGRHDSCLGLVEVCCCVDHLPPSLAFFGLRSLVCVVH